MVVSRRSDLCGTGIKTIRVEFKYTGGGRGSAPDHHDDGGIDAALPQLLLKARTGWISLGLL